MDKKMDASLDAKQESLRISRAAQLLRQRGETPRVGVILGSGAGGVIQDLRDAVRTPYEMIPYFPMTTVAGHAGEWVCARVGECPVAFMSGRFHLYEGNSPWDVIRPVRVMRALGVQTLVVTNAAGGINLAFAPGDIMAITDHINFCGTNPLVGPNLPDFGLRFPDMTHAYDRALIDLVRQCADGQNTPLREGVYIQVMGPSFETPAEIRMMRTMGADAVGMSTVPEVIAASHCGMRVLGLSLISNSAAGVTGKPLSHEEVNETAAQASARFSALLLAILARL